MNKKYTFIAILMLLFLASCNDVTNTEQTEEVVQTIENQNSLEKEEIKLSENGISYNGSNAKVDGNIITIKKY
jgi:lipoprotein NlpI